VVDERGLNQLVDELVALAGVEAIARVEPGLAVTRRVSGDRSFLFLINAESTDLTASASGRDLLSGNDHEGSVVVPAGGVVVLDERR
jgi:beta-galactosidase